MPIVLKSGSFYSPEAYWPVKACNGIVLLLFITSALKGKLFYRGLFSHFVGLRVLYSS
jgi:hypothetical protein